MAQVYLTRRKWWRNAWGVMKEQTDYAIFIGDFRLRGFSTFGNMDEGYWGDNAHELAESYAKEVAKAACCQVVKVRIKTKVA